MPGPVLRLPIRSVKTLFFTDTLPVVVVFAVGVKSTRYWVLLSWVKADNLPPLGVMDPTLAYGEESAITSLDLRALDLIGWEIEATPVPLPASVVLLATGALALCRRRERRAESV